MLRNRLSAALLVACVASAAPATSFAGVMPIADNATVGLSAPAAQAHWEPYRHRHHRWHMGWHYGWPRFRYGYAGWNPGNAAFASAAPVYGGCGTYGAAYPVAGGCGAYGAAYPTCGGCGAYGYAGGGLFGLGFPGGGLFGLGLGPL